MKLLGKHRFAYFLVVGCSALVQGGEALLHPLLMKAIFDSVASPTSFSAFIPLGIGYLALGITVNVLSYFVFVWRVNVDNRIVAAISTSLLESYYTVTYSDLLKLGSGYYITRIRSDVKDGLVPMLTTVRDIIVGSISFVLLISVLIYISWQAFLILALVIPVCASASRIVSKKIRRLNINERESEGVLIDVLNRAISAFKIVQGFSLVPSSVAAFATTMDRNLDSSREKLRMVRLLQSAGDMTRVVSDVCSILVGAYLVIHSRLTIGSFIAFMNAFWRSSSTLTLVLNKWAEAHGYSATLDRLVEFNQTGLSPVVTEVGSKLCADRIFFGYDDSPIISDFSLSISAGERVLIVGENGSGKTTIANILAGYLHPSTGKLTLPPRVSAATLPTNFPPIPIADLGIDPSLLRSFSIGAESQKSSRPDFLSAGQQQKLAVALAISRDADLYILDEPLANLDRDGRDAVMKEVDNRTGGRALIMIMHDADRYLQFFDRIINLSETKSDTMTESGAC